MKQRAISKEYKTNTKENVNDEKEKSGKSYLTNLKQHFSKAFKNNNKIQNEQTNNLIEQSYKPRMIVQTEYYHPKEQITTISSNNTNNNNLIIINNEHVIGA